MHMFALHLLIAVFMTADRAVLQMLLKTTWMKLKILYGLVYIF